MQTRQVEGIRYVGMILSGMGDAAALPVAELLTDETLETRWAAAFILTMIGADARAALPALEKTLANTGLERIAEKRLVEANRVASGLVKAAADYDMIVIGASKEGVFSSVLFGEIPEKVARYSRTPVMIVRRYEGAVKSLVKKVMG